LASVEQLALLTEPTNMYGEDVDGYGVIGTEVSP
jgi:hypothetical protein